METKKRIIPSLVRRKISEKKHLSDAEQVKLMSMGDSLLIRQFLSYAPFSTPVENTLEQEQPDFFTGEYILHYSPNYGILRRWMRAKRFPLVAKVCERHTLVHPLQKLILGLPEEGVAIDLIRLQEQRHSLFPDVRAEARRRGWIL